MYVLVLLMLNVTNFATTFGNGFHSFKSEKSCQFVADKIKSEAVKKHVDSSLIVFCAPEGDL